MKYLIIDDKPEMRKIIAQTLCNEDDSFMECSDGDDAVEAYMKFQPDFVLMDIQMKKTDGIKATRLIRQRFATARIIVITDYDTPSFRSVAINGGAMAFFSKENLIEIRNYIEQTNKKEILL